MLNQLRNMLRSGIRISLSGLTCSTPSSSDRFRSKYQRFSDRCSKAASIRIWMLPHGCVQEARGIPTTRHTCGPVLCLCLPENNNGDVAVFDARSMPKPSVCFNGLPHGQTLPHGGCSLLEGRLVAVAAVPPPSPVAAGDAAVALLPP